MGLRKKVIALSILLTSLIGAVEALSIKRTEIIRSVGANSSSANKASKRRAFSAPTAVWKYLLWLLVIVVRYPNQYCQILQSNY